jgi:Fe-S-cluster containining protein
MSRRRSKRLERQRELRREIRERRARDVSAELQSLYDSMPKLQCQGHCHSSCGPIEMSAAEHKRIHERTGKAVDVNDCLTCNMLSPITKTCTVYDIRPALCRLWGLTEGMPCPWGCRPEGGLIPDEEGFRFIARAMDIGGWPDGWQGATLKRVEKALSDPEVVRMMRSMLLKPTKEG